MTEGTPAPGKFKVAVEGTGLTMDTEVDQATALQVVNLLMGGKVTPPTSPPDGEDGGGGSTTTPRRHSAPTEGKGQKGKAKRKGGAGKGKSVSLDKNLGLHPKSKKSFPDFAEEKKPTTHDDKITVAVYWLQKTLGYNATAEAINSCYKGAGWTRPTDLRNAIAQVGSKKAWLDTQDRGDIKVTNSGEDRVEHELPATTKK